MYLCTHRGIVPRISTEILYIRRAPHSTLRANKTCWFLLYNCLLSNKYLRIAVLTICLPVRTSSPYKQDTKQWKTTKVDDFVAHNNTLRCRYSAERMAKEGTYNMLLGEIGEKEYMGSKETYDSVDNISKQVFPKGFPVEILEVYSGPPSISCTWRHWGEHAGPYQAADDTMYKPTGKRIELFGQGVIKVTTNMQITEMQMYFDTATFIKELMSGGGN